MNKKILFANGCSWTAGNGIEFDPLLSHIEKKEHHVYQRKYAWPQILADLNKSRCINLAQGGGSNKRMVRTTCDFLFKTDPLTYEDLTVVLGWTTLDRNEVFISENGNEEWAIFNAQEIPQYEKFSKSYLREVEEYRKKYITHIFNAIPNYISFFQEMYLMSNLLENLNIKYLFFSSLPWTWNFGQSIDIKEKFYREIDILTKPTILNIPPGDNTMGDFCQQNNIPMTHEHHTMIEGHKRWAFYLNEKLENIYNSAI